MDIRVSDIPDEGLELEFTEGREELAPAEDGLRYISPAAAKLTLKKVGSAIMLEGEVKAELGLECSRCGSGFELAADTGFTLELSPLGSITGEDEKELHEGDLEVEFFSGDTIDVSGIVREQLLLQVPMKPLCREDCRGLCPQCGQDKNIADCGCEEPTGHLGFAGLKDLLDKDKKKQGK